MTDPRVRARRLGAAALGAVAFFFLGAIQLPLFFSRFPHRPETADVLNYLAAARVGLGHGWSHIYNPDLQRPAYIAVSGAPKFEWLNMFVSPPPVAWLVAPLTAFPTDVAYWVWATVGLAALAVAAWRVSPWSGPGRVVALLVGFSLYPVLISLQFGQVTPLIAGATGLAWDALRRDRETTAGLLLVAVALKPQVGVFVPLALLLAGYRRCFVVWLAGAGALAAVSLASIGISGFQQLMADLAEEQRHLDNEVWTLAWLVGVGAPAVVAEAVCVGAALAVGWLTRGRRDPGPPMIAGALGSLLGAGYHHSIDFPSILVLGLIQLRTLPGWRAAGFVAAGLAACLVIPSLGPGLLLVFLIAWLATTALLAWAPSRLVGRAPEQRDAVPPAVARLP